jgi:hypothetical protein
LLLAPGATRAQDVSVPVRLNIRFIVDAGGNRPATGRLNTDAEIIAEFDAGNDILRGLLSEFQLVRLTLADLAGVSQWYASQPTAANRDALRAAAIAAPVTYGWRTDAINIYINGATGSAIGTFPPNNQMILMSQGCTNTPSCMLHEVGHNTNLLHTHQSGGADGCADTIADNSSWTRDQLSQANFGDVYANLTAPQQAQVDTVWKNVMSYHVSLPQDRLSPCQMDRESTQGYADRSWMLTKTPIYVDSSNTTAPYSGTFVDPFNDFQDALSAGGLTGKVIVVEQSSSYTMTQPSVSDDVGVMTRSGTSTIQGAQWYTLPAMEDSRTAAVSAAAKDIQAEDKAGRDAKRVAENAAVGAATQAERDSILAAGRQSSERHRNNALGHLMRAEKLASGDEKLAIQFELAERFEHAGNCNRAAEYYLLVAEATDQENLKLVAEYRADVCGQ